MNSIAITGNKLTLELEMTVYQEDGLFFADCRALHTTGYGDTEQEAKDSLILQLNILFEYALEHKTLDKLLTKYGWNKKQDSYWVPVELLPRTERLELSF